LSAGLTGTPLLPQEPAASRGPAACSAILEAPKRSLTNHRSTAGNCICLQPVQCRSRSTNSDCVYKDVVLPAYSAYAAEENIGLYCNFNCCATSHILPRILKRMIDRLRERLHGRLTVRIRSISSIRLTKTFNWSS
jgi:hypothetical protein